MSHCRAGPASASGGAGSRMMPKSCSSTTSTTTASATPSTSIGRPARSGDTPLSAPRRSPVAGAPRRLSALRTTGRVAAITAVPTWAGFRSLAVVLDVHSRRYAGRAPADHLRVENSSSLCCSYTLASCGAFLRASEILVVVGNIASRSAFVEGAVLRGRRPFFNSSKSRISASEAAIASLPCHVPDICARKIASVPRHAVIAAGRTGNSRGQPLDSSDLGAAFDRRGIRRDGLRLDDRCELAVLDPLCDLSPNAIKNSVWWGAHLEIDAGAIWAGVPAVRFWIIRPTRREGPGQLDPAGSQVFGCGQDQRLWSRGLRHYGMRERVKLSNQGTNKCFKVL